MNRSSFKAVCAFAGVFVIAMTLVLQDGNISSTVDPVQENGIQMNSDVIGSFTDPDYWTPPIVPDHIMNAGPDDPILIDHIREHWILSPSNQGRRLAKPDKIHYSQIGQSQIIDDLLANKTRGFFVECGAGNGERLSNTLFFEKTRSWTGLLVEPNPDTFADLLAKRRHAFAMNACLSPGDHPMKLTLRKATLASALEDFTDSEHDVSVLRSKGKYQGTVEVQCFPLRSVLKALHVSRIDYFSLDVEGAEIPILNTTPFDSVDISTFSVEYETDDEEAQTKKKDTILEIFTMQGYELIEDMDQDLIFVKQSR